MSSQSVLACSQFTTSSDGSISCTQQTWTETYVLSPDEQAQLELVIGGGFDAGTFTLFFNATLALFAIGFGVGIIISQIRKAKRG
ncbi:hypothetical protein [Pseudomonas huanghezhanensis]|uniref:hypothetical protein n=1 Tax=Pseudomonas huanghezhanensis TaxID=3002903 RepID=UPI002286CE02|nr:hypothetical protein [Pseudomonas sp. BSw22131]